MKINIVVMDVINDVTYSRKIVHTHVVITLLLHALSTRKQQRHMIKTKKKFC